MHCPPSSPAPCAPEWARFDSVRRFTASSNATLTHRHVSFVAVPRPSLSSRNGPVQEEALRRQPHVKSAENCAVQAHKRCAAISHTSPARGSPAPHAVASIVRMAGHDFCAVEFICSRGGRADYRAHLADSLAHLAHPRSHLAHFRAHLVVSRAHLCLMRLRRQRLCTCRVWSAFCLCLIGRDVPGVRPGGSLAELYVIPCECGWHAVLSLCDSM